jgi:hypothetical protein
MNKEVTVTAQISESAARERIDKYFTQAGYQLNENKGKILSFQRGSKLGSWVPRNPSDLLTKAVVEVQEKGNQTQIKAEFEIKLTIKDESHFTEVFWEQELKDFEIAILKNQYTPLKSKKLTQRNIIANIKSMGPALLYILIWGVIAGILIAIVIFIPGRENWDPYLVALLVMAAAAAATVFLVRFWKKWRKSRSQDSSS